MLSAATAKSESDAEDGSGGTREEGGKGVMTETASGPGGAQGQARQQGPDDRAHSHDAGRAPLRRGHLGARDVVMTNWRDGSINFEQRGVEFPDFWSVNAANIVTTKYFRGAVGTPQREWSLQQLIDRVVERLHAGRPGARLLRLRRGRRDLRARADVRAAAPGVQLQLAGLVQRRDHLAAAGVSACFILVGRRHDGLDPQLVPRRGPDLQGRLRRGPEPVAHPLVQGAAVLAVAPRPAR